MLITLGCFCGALRLKIKKIQFRKKKSSCSFPDVTTREQKANVTRRQLAGL